MSILFFRGMPNFLGYTTRKDKIKYHCLVSDRRHYPVSLKKDDAFIKNVFFGLEKSIGKI